MLNITRRIVPTINQSLPCHPILQRVYLARGVTCPTQLEKELKHLLPFDTLTGIDKATKRLELALRQNERILIIGDFDADGATSSALAVCALKSMGAKHVEFLVPNRFEFGYGLTPGIVGIAKKYKPDLIITVDNGIASFEGIIAANEANIDVLVTDHHLSAEELPTAYAIVNPNQPEDEFPSKAIAGVGVIFYVMLALRRRLVENNWFSEQNINLVNMAQFLDLVALGTVADVVALDKNNRILVYQGIQRIRKGLCRPGIKALIEIAGKNISNLREQDLGFSIAPRLNAAGRLDDMALGIECLIEPSYEKALILASELNELNLERRKIEAEMKEQALLVLENLTLEKHSKELPLALCLLDPDWHQGVIGILAGRLKDRYNRPVVIFARVSDDELKGSARSIPYLNIRDVLAAIDKDNPGVITKFGGHAMAAGLSLTPQMYSKFQLLFVNEVSKHLSLSQCQDECQTDGALTLSELNLQIAFEIRESGPWGQQFPEPIFDNKFVIVNQRLIGKNHLKLTLLHSEGGNSLEAIAFNVDLEYWPDENAKYIHAVYRLDINEYQGRIKLQLIIEKMQIIDQL